MWVSAAETLNAHGDGAVKDWRSWSKYWNDYKSKLKKTVASNRASHQLTGGGPSETVHLSDIEKRFLQILGDSFGSGLPGVRVEPFNQVPEEEEVEVEEEEEGRATENLSRSILDNSIFGRPSRASQSSSPQHTPPASVRTATPASALDEPATPRRSPRRPAPRCIAQPAEQRRIAQPAEQRRIAEPAEPRRIAEPAEPRRIAEPAEPRRIAEPAEPRRIAEPAEQRRIAEPAEQRRIAEPAEQRRIAEPAEQRRIAEPAEQRRIAAQRRIGTEPRRRRQRREPPVSQEAARRALINISNERAQEDRHRNEALRQLVVEIKEIKDLLRARLPVPELPDTPNLNLT